MVFFTAPLLVPLQNGHLKNQPLVAPQANICFHRLPFYY